MLVPFIDGVHRSYSIPSLVDRFKLLTGRGEHKTESHGQTQQRVHLLPALDKSGLYLFRDLNLGNRLPSLLVCS